MTSVSFDIDYVLKWQDVGGNVCDEVQITRANAKPGIQKRQLEKLISCLERLLCTLNSTNQPCFPRAQNVLQLWEMFDMMDDIVHPPLQQNSFTIKTFFGVNYNIYKSADKKNGAGDSHLHSFWSLKVCKCVIFPLSLILFLWFCNLSHYTVAIFSIWCPHPCLPPPNAPRSNWTVCERCEMSKIIPCSQSAGSRQQETELNKRGLCGQKPRFVLTATQQSDPRFNAKLHVSPVHHGWPEHKSQDDMFSVPSWRSDCWKVRFSISDPEGDVDKHSSIN